MSHDLPAKTQRLLDLAKLFLKLGITAFGGPAAHVAISRSALWHQLDGRIGVSGLYGHSHPGLA